MAWPSSWQSLEGIALACKYSVSQSRPSGPRLNAPKSRTGFSSAKQVAELAGVSRSAVSRTFTPGASVSEETRERVLSAAEALGYHVKHLERGLLRA